jgi:hypothetical protein
VTDVYDERAAEAEDARPEAVRAAANIARAVKIGGRADPAYVANVIEDELRRFEDSPDDPIIERPWIGTEPVTGMTVDELLSRTEFEPPPGTHPNHVNAARAATIRIARAYGPSVGPHLPEFLATTPHMIVEQLTQGPADAYAADVEEALEAIQAHRRTLGMRPLDVRSAGWSNLDVLDEAQRIARLPNPLEDLKHRLI